MLAQSSKTPFFYAVVKEKELKRQCNFEIVTVKPTNKNARYWFEVANLKKKTEYMVRLSRKLATLTCTCPWGTNEVGSEEIDEGHRCKHILAVRKFLNQKLEASA